MVRSTLSHEVRGLLVNLGIHLNNLDTSILERDRAAARTEVDDAKADIRTVAKDLSQAINLSVTQLKMTPIEPSKIFSQNELLTKARNLRSRTNRLRERTIAATELGDGGAVVHRTALNIERMVEISNSLFGDEEAMSLEGVNPSTILKDIEALTPAADTQRVIIERSSIPTFRAYRRELISAASNLVRNGLKYSLDEAPSIVRVELSRRRLQELLGEFPAADALISGRAMQDEFWVCLKVSDTGRGIPEGLIGAVFKPFVRLDEKGQPKVLKDQAEPVEAADEGGGGQGFGLTLVKRVAELHQGVVVAKSVSPHGMVFGILFPFIRNQTADPIDP